MGISYKDFKTGNFDKKASNDRLKHPTYVFLKQNKNNAYTIKEICKGTKMKEDAVRNMLRILISKKLVLHKQPYFTLNR